MLKVPPHASLCLQFEALISELWKRLWNINHRSLIPVFSYKAVLYKNRPQNLFADFNTLFFFHLPALPQMLADLARMDLGARSTLASFPVTLLHEGGNRAGAESETGAGTDRRLPGNARQESREINTSAGASALSKRWLQLEKNHVRVMSLRSRNTSRDVRFVKGQGRGKA